MEVDCSTGAHLYENGRCTRCQAPQPPFSRPMKASRCSSCKTVRVPHAGTIDGREIIPKTIEALTCSHPNWEPIEVEVFVGVDFGRGSDKAVLSIVRRDKDGKLIVHNDNHEPTKE